MAGEINISVLIRLAAEHARREAAAFGGDVKALGAAAEEAGRKTAAAGAAIDQAGAAAASAASGIAATHAALAQAVSQAGSFTAQLGQTATAIGGVQSAVAGLTMAMGAEVEAMLREQQAAAAWQAELDGLRARFVPLFAASQQYEAQVRQISEAEQLGALSAQEAATARYRAEQSYQALAASITATVAPINQMMGAMTAAETVMQRQVAAFAGIKIAADDAFSAQMRHGAMLDELKAKFNPVFAASREYEVQLHGIAEAERLGAISSQEAAAARTRAAQALAPINAGLGQFGDNSRAAGAHAANLSFQMNDIFMMTAVGQSPWMLMMQQGPQVIQIMGQMRQQGLSLGTALRGSLAMVLNPVGLLTMGMIGLGAAGIQALSKIGGKTKTFDEELKDLNTTLSRMRSNMELLGNIRLEDTFGSLTDSVRGLAQGMLDLDRAAELKQLGEVIDGFLSKEVKVPWYSWDSLSMGMAMGVAPMPGMTTDDFVNNTPGRSDRYTELGAANSYEDFEKRTADIKTLADAGDIDGVTRALMELQAAMAGGGSVTGMKDELRELLAELTKTGLETARIEALWNGSGQDNAIANQIDKMVLGYTQQLELAEASLRFGENSVEVEQVRAQHAREALRIRLEDMKVQQGSAEELRAYAALNAKINADADAAQDRRQKAQDEVFADIGRQGELSTAILKFGEDSAEVEAVRARHAWDLQAARLAEMGLAPPLIALAQALFQAERNRANAIREGAAAKRGQDMLTELREEAAISQAILIYGEDSLKVKELQAAAERRAYEQSLQRQDLSEADLEIILRQYDATVAVSAAAARWQQNLDGVGARLRTIGGLLLDIGSAAQDVAAQELELGALRGGASPDDAAYAARLDQLNREYDARVAGAKNVVERELIEQERRLAQRQLQLERELGMERDAAGKRAELTKAAQGYLRGQNETLQMLRLEASLLGETEATRARILALAEAEQWIRSQQIDTNSALAGQIREAAAAKADETRELQNQIDAWGRVEDAAGSAIDGIVDSLMDADIGGAFDAVLKEVTGLFTDLAIKNPLKNAILGTDAPTLQDAGGLGGIWDRLTGQGAALSPTASSMGVGTMQVNAATVIINGGISGALGGVTGVMGAANLTGAPGGWTGASGQAASVLSSVAVGGGTRPDAISGLNAGFADPLAAMVADAQKIFGAEAIKITSGFRSVEVQQRLWDEALVKYGSPEAARQWVAPPGKSRHNYGLAADLGFGGADVKDWAHQNAGRYGLDFRMQNEPWHIEPQNAAAMMSGAAPAALGEADRVLAQFASTAQSATGQLGTLGGGFDAFGSALAGALTGGNGAEGLFGTIFGAMGIPGFATGGYTGSGHPARVAGVVHEEEYVFDARATAAIGVDNLEALRQGARSGWRGGFASGGYVSALPVPAPPPANRAGGAGGGGPMRVSFNLVNNSGVPIEAEGEATVDETGGITVDARLNRAVAQAVTQRGGPTDKALRARGAKAQTWRRS